MFLCLFVYVGDDALPNGLDVTFEVTELRRLTGSYNTMVGNNEGSMVWIISNNLLIPFDIPLSCFKPSKEFGDQSQIIFLIQLY